MGDYTKIIIHAEYKGSKNHLMTALLDLRLCDSAYHCGGVIESVEKNSRGNYDITIIGQTKYGGRQENFIDWITPFIHRGFGSKNLFAMQFDEYSDAPVCFYK